METSEAARCRNEAGAESFSVQPLVPHMVDFIGREEARRLARKETVIFVEIMGEAKGKRSLEVHVMRPTAEGLYEVERDDTGLIPGETIGELVERLATAHGCRYATIYPAEDQWPPRWVSRSCRRAGGCD